MNVRRNHTHDESVDDGDVIHSVPNCCAWAAVRDNRRRMNVWNRRMEWGKGGEMLRCCGGDNS